MKTLKEILSVMITTIIVTSALTLTSCTKKEEIGGPMDIVGSWKLISQSFDGAMEYPDDPYEGMIVTFSYSGVVTSYEFWTDYKTQELHAASYSNNYTYDNMKKSIVVMFTKPQIMDVLVLNASRLALRDTISYTNGEISKKSVRIMYFYSENAP